MRSWTKIEDSQPHMGELILIRIKHGCVELGEYIGNKMFCTVYSRAIGQVVKWDRIPSWDE